MRGILIAGNESALLNYLGAEAARRSESYALAVIKNRLSGGNQIIDNTEINGSKSLVSIEWNPYSPISAGTLVLAAENTLDNISEAILVCNPPSVRCAAAEIKIVDVETLVNDHIKGWFYLIKELACKFREKGDGTLVLVFPEYAAAGKDDIADHLGTAALASFKALTLGLLSASSSEPYLTMGFSGVCAGDEAGFASFIFKQIDEKNRRNDGKLHKYGKTGFFR